MAWLEIERKAEAIMQAAERNIKCCETLQADLEPPWDGFCGLVRVCDDEELKERGVIRAVVPPACRRQASQQPTHGSMSQPAAQPALASSSPSSASVCNAQVQAASKASSVSNPSSSRTPTAGTSSMQRCSASQSNMPEQAAAVAAPLFSAISADTAIQTAAQHQQQQLQRHSYTSPAPQHPTPTQQQPSSNPIEEPVSIASCIQSLAGHSAVDPLDLLSDDSSSPRQGTPSWVVSYLLGPDSSDSDEQSNGNDKPSNNTGVGGGAGALEPMNAQHTAFDVPPPQHPAPTAVEVEPLDTAATSGSPAVHSGDAVATATATAAAVAVATADAASAKHAEVQHHTLGKQEAHDACPDRIEQLLQEALAAADEHQQLQQPEAAASAATVIQDVSPAPAALLSAAARVLGATEGVASETTTDNLAELAVAAEAVDSLICSADGHDECSWSAAAAGGSYMLTAEHEEAELLDAAAALAALELKHGAGAAVPECPNSSAEGRHTSMALNAAAAAGGGGDSSCEMSCTAADEVEELLEAASDAASLEKQHAAPGAGMIPAAAAAAVRELSGVGGAPSACSATASLAAGSHVSGGVSGFDVSAEAAVAAAATVGSASTAALHTFGADLPGLLTAAGTAAALHSKHGRTAAGAAADVCSSETESSGDEADRLVAAVVDAAVLDIRHNGAAAWGGDSGHHTTRQQQQQQQQAEKEDNDSEDKPEDEDLFSSSGVDDDSVSDSCNSDDEEEALDLLEELPEVPSHVVVVPNKAAQRKQGSSSSSKNASGSSSNSSTGDKPRKQPNGKRGSK